MVSLTLNVQRIVGKVLVVIRVKDKLGIDLFCCFRLLFHLVTKRKNGIRILSFLLAVFNHNNFIVGFLLFRCNILLFVSVIIIQIYHFKIIQKSISLNKFLFFLFVNYLSCSQILKLIQSRFCTMKTIYFHFRFLKSVLNCLSNIFLFFR